MATQSDYVMELMKKNNGYLTLREIYEKVCEDNDSPFEEKSYQTNIRAFLQKESHRYFRIKPGLWALVEYKDRLPKEIIEAIQETNVSYYDTPKAHAQMQANIIFIGKKLGFETYIYTQDNKRTFDKEKRLTDIVDTNFMPNFTYEGVLKKIRTIDVIWFEDGVSIDGIKYKYPKVVFEVEDSTYFEKSLNKFKLLKMFDLKYMYIVAPETREGKFDEIIMEKDYDDIREKVKFLQYEDIESFLENPKLLLKFRLI